MGASMVFVLSMSSRLNQTKPATISILPFWIFSTDFIYAVLIFI
jgi:hypothetical protein